ncbi:MAG: hypothetical protein U0163_11025 [Gemmatimonadaceae bacterium]
MTGQGNDDGFTGQYSFIRKDPRGLVLADLKGPGVLYRFHTPTPTADTLEFYFDGESNAAVGARDARTWCSVRAPRSCRR